MSLQASLLPALGSGALGPTTKGSRGASQGRGYRAEADGNTGLSFLPLLGPAGSNPLPCGRALPWALGATGRNLASSLPSSSPQGWKKDESGGRVAGSRQPPPSPLTLCSRTQQPIQEQCVGAVHLCYQTLSLVLFKS